LPFPDCKNTLIGYTVHNYILCLLIQFGVLSMKKTTLLRKTHLKSKTGLKSKTVLKSKTALKVTTTCPSVKTYGGDKGDQKNGFIKGRGLQGVGRTEAHKGWHSKVITLGCFACTKLGVEPISRLCIHHTNGRNKGKGDFSEWSVFCLCELHHDPSVCSGFSTKGLSVHHNKKLFISTIGTETWCVHETFRELNLCPPWLDEEMWMEYLSISDKDLQEIWLVNSEKNLLNS